MATKKEYFFLWASALMVLLSSSHLVLIKQVVDIVLGKINIILTQGLNRFTYDFPIYMLLRLLTDK